MTNKIRNVSWRPFLALAFVFSFVFCMFTTNINVSAVSEEQAMKNLTAYVYSKVSQQEYTLEGGGSIKGAELFDQSKTKGYDLNEREFTKLSSKAQSDLVSDIALYSNEAVEDEKVKGVEETTVQNWWKQLQMKEGVGSKFMNEILKNTKPDFVTANKIYQPFSGLVGTVMGIGAVLIMAFLGLVIVADIAYMTLPPVRMFVSENGDNGKKPISHVFSHDAILAVKLSEESGNSAGGGESKQALGIYFKRRVWMLIILGICLLYLVQGQIYTLVGWILNLVSGFLGF